MFRSFKVTRKSCASLRLINSILSCDVQRVQTHLICEVLSDLIHHGFINHDVTHDFLVTLYDLYITLRHRLSYLHIKQI